MTIITDEYPKITIEEVEISDVEKRWRIKVHGVVNGRFLEAILNVAPAKSCVVFEKDTKNNVDEVLQKRVKKNTVVEYEVDNTMVE